ncbi:MAG: hypothetical protein U0175_14400 [Caldilineaceae bacterium]
MKIQRLIQILSILLLVSVLVPSALYAQSPLANKIAVVRAKGAVLVDQTGKAKDVQIAAGALLIVQGRNADSSQLFVITEEGQVGWVSTNSLLVVDTASLPVFEAASSPNEAATATPAAPGTIPAPATQAAVSPQLPSKPTRTTEQTATADLSTVGITAQVISQTARLNLRSGPGIGFAIIGKADAGSEWRAVGRSPQSDWVQIADFNSDELFWAATAYITLSAPVAQLAIPANLPPTPTPQPVVLLPTPTSLDGITLTATSTPASSSNGAKGKTGLAGTLVFQDRAGGTIYVYNLATDALRTLTGGIDPAISPDGKLVAFTRDGGDRGLYVINIDGSGERRMYNDRELLRSPKWSPDGSKIVFTRSNGYTDCRILQGKVCMPDSAILDLLPEELQGGQITEKAIKDLPNSRQYFFTLSRVRLDNGEFRDIASKGMAGAPDWSNGGIVYQSDNGLQRTDDQPNADSQRIAQDIQVGNYIDPDQQPNGGRIVFQYSHGGHWQIFGINPDGSGMAALTSLATVMVDALPSNVSPAWSPDGQQIVYLSNRNSYESAGPWHLWVMNADGSNQRLLPIEVEFTYSFGAEQMVSWGP